jgi:hypothetical protein
MRFRNHLADYPIPEASLLPGKCVEMGSGGSMTKVTLESNFPPEREDRKSYKPVSPLSFHKKIWGGGANPAAERRDFIGVDEEWFWLLPLEIPGAIIHPASRTGP